jgi:polyhydroxyalkanoate synthesis regulator phasin
MEEIVALVTAATGYNLIRYFSGYKEAEEDIILGGNEAVENILNENSDLESSKLKSLLKPYSKGRYDTANAYTDLLETREGVDELADELVEQRESRKELDKSVNNHMMVEGGEYPKQDELPDRFDRDISKPEIIEEIQIENLRHTQREFQKKNHSIAEGYGYLVEAERITSSLN